MFDMTGIYLLLGVLLVLGLGLVALYVLQSVGLYRLAQNAGMPAPMLAWVPVARQYLLGCLCDRGAYCRAGRRWNFALWLPIVTTLGSPWTYVAVTELFSGTYTMMAGGWMLASGLQGLLGIAATVLSAVALYSFYSDYAPGQEGGYTVLSVVLPFAAPPVLIFLLRNRCPVSVSGVRPPAPQGRTVYTTGAWQSPPPPPPPPPGCRPPAPPSVPGPGWLDAPEAANRWQPGSDDGDFYQGGGSAR